MLIWLNIDFTELYSILGPGTPLSGARGGGHSSYSLYPGLVCWCAGVLVCWCQGCHWGRYTDHWSVYWPLVGIPTISVGRYFLTWDKNALIWVKNSQKRGKNGNFSGNDTLGSKVWVNLAEIVRVGWGQEERISNFSTRSGEKFEIISSWPQPTSTIS